MKCPACQRELQELTVGGLTVDVCRGGCGGTWFDQLELQKVDEPHEALGEELLAIPTDPQLVVDTRRRRTCPRCQDQPMLRHQYAMVQEVEVDECPRCGGYFLDGGELEVIRSRIEQARSDPAARAALLESFQAQMDAMRAETRARSQRIQSVTRIFRFIMPSHYVKGIFRR